MKRWKRKWVTYRKYTELEEISTIKVSITTPPYIVWLLEAEGYVRS